MFYYSFAVDRLNGFFINFNTLYTMNTQSKKLQFLLSIGELKDITNVISVNNMEPVKDGLRRYYFRFNDADKYDICDLTMDLPNVKEFINILFNDLTCKGSL